jgi:hypothetical protein
VRGDDEPFPGANGVDDLLELSGHVKSSVVGCELWVVSRKSFVNDLTIVCRVPCAAC